jgi:hypothetical protein
MDLRDATMNRSSHPCRYLLLLLAWLVVLGALTAPVNAADSAPLPDTILGSATAPAALFGGFTDNVLGNRQQMVRYAFAAFGIGVLILVTATRKH